MGAAALVPLALTTAGAIIGGAKGGAKGALGGAGLGLGLGSGAVGALPSVFGGAAGQQTAQTLSSIGGPLLGGAAQLFPEQQRPASLSLSPIQLGAGQDLASLLRSIAGPPVLL